MKGWLRSRIYDFWIGLKPSRFGLLIVALLILGLMEPWTGQGRDALQDYASSDFSDEDLRRRLWLYAMTFCLAILTWFFCRLSNGLRFKDEPPEMLRYRQDFPRAPFVRTNPEALADANVRVNNILSTRKWAPRILGILIPLVVALAFLLNVGKAAWREVLIFLPMAIFVGAAVIGRREVQNWLADWFSRRQQPGLSIFLRVGDAKDAVTAWSEVGGFARAVLGIVGAFVTLSIVCALVWPLDFGRFFGPLPVIMLSLTVIVGIGSLLAIRTRHSNFPWFTAVIAAIAVASMFGGHTMRFANDPIAPDQRLKPKKLAEQFIGKPSGDAPKPAILIATAGGGSRAAYWTATVLGELNKIPGFNDHLLIISGVSGGSLGAVLYRAATLAAPDAPDKALKALAIAQEAAAGDFLSPLLSAMFTRDLVSDLIPGLPDRAEVLEQAWSDSFDKACRDELKTETCPVNLNDGFLKLWPEEKWPALILNGTVVETGGRAVASNLDLHCERGGAKATCGLVDVTDILAYSNLDLTASSAINVSARFPVLGPSAVTIIDEEGNKRSVVDGGYFDNSGALTLQQVMQELAPEFNAKKIVPIVIQITSDPDFKWWNTRLRGHLDPGAREPGGHQLVMPLRTYLGLRNSYGRQAMLGLRSLAEPRYVTFDQCKDGVAGSGAPLAWVISSKAQELLKGLLINSPEAKKDLEADPEAKRDSETCRNNNEASFTRVKDCLKDVNGAKCLGTEAEGRSPNNWPSGADFTDSGQGGTRVGLAVRLVP
jgi:hypothetical protein